MTTTRRRAKQVEPVEPQEPLNGALRDHVSRYAFVLSLRPSHIAALVHVERLTRLEPAGPRVTHAQSSANRGDPRPYRKDPDGTVRLLARLDSAFVPGVRGLRERGLVEHHYQPDTRSEHDRWKSGDSRPFGDHYEITSAGWHVIGLLKGAGLWQAYLDSMPWFSEKGTKAA